MARKTTKKYNPALDNIEHGRSMLMDNPIFSPLLMRIRVDVRKDNECPEGGWALADARGIIHVNVRRVAQPQEWVFILAHCVLHFAFDHFKDKDRPVEWNVACDCFINTFLTDLHVAPLPLHMHVPTNPLPNDEERLYRELCSTGIPDELLYCGTAGKNSRDMEGVTDTRRRYWYGADRDWKELFADGIRLGVSKAISRAAGVDDSNKKRPPTASEQAKKWFMSHYPLLGSLAASFKIMEDMDVCRALDVRVAAVDEWKREIYLNPAAALKGEEVRFVMAHEMLHAGLRHQSRCLGRDDYLWNVSCDFLVNGWLVEMKIGEMPQFGALWDEDLKGLSAESIYDRIVKDMRKYRKLATLRGVGTGDIIRRSDPGWWNSAEGMSLDEFYRRCLTQGLVYHQQSWRGTLPAGLTEEIRALDHPVVPWDVELAQWFDNYFAPLEARRSYARLSRRQSATPEIPRPRCVPTLIDSEARTFGVVLDTSCSVNHVILSKALGAIASYGISRDVPFVRVVFCDAEAYDEGYLAPEEIAGRVRIKGRGGTILQPGVDILEKAKDFPKTGPILIITDGACEENLTVKRDHAFLMPRGARLPFVPRGKILWMDHRIPKMPPSGKP